MRARCLFHLSFQWFRSPVPLFAPLGPSGRFPNFSALTAALRFLASPPRSASSLRSVVPVSRRVQGLPGSWATPACVPWPNTPVGRSVQDPGLASLRLDWSVVAFHVGQRVGPTTYPLSGLAHLGPHARCLRFAVWLPVQLQTPRKTRFRLAVLHLGRSGFSPAGRYDWFRCYITSSNPRLYLAQARS